MGNCIVLPVVQSIHSDWVSQHQRKVTIGRDEILFNRKTGLSK
jgi:hypothetical protein